MRPVLPFVIPFPARRREGAPFPARRAGEGRLPRRRRRGGASAPPCRRLAAGWLAATIGAAAVFGGEAAAAPPDRCGRPGLVGLGSHAELSAAGALSLSLTLTDGPIDPLPVRALVFVDGVLRAGGPDLELPCGREIAWSTPPTGALHALHWTLMPWPAVPPALAALAPDEASIRFGDRGPPGLYPWADVELLRPLGASPAGRSDPVTLRPAPAGELSDDRVDVLGTDGAPLAERMVRVAVRQPIGFRLRYLAGELGGGALIATCLLDGRQLDAFAGRPFVAGIAAVGYLLEIDGEVEVPEPGWHRLHCLLLPDVPGERPATWPRPLLSVYLWGDG
jgi:hypothetical protein